MADNATGAMAAAAVRVSQQGDFVMPSNLRTSNEVG
jgi:hypothetical protein